jgi:quinol monooxygenase YgiN
MIKKNEVQVVCVAEWCALEGKTEELLTALHGLLADTHKEPGCIRYELNQRVDDDRWITFVEKWTDQKAFDEHCQMPYIKHFFEELRPPLCEEFAVKLYREILP